MPRARVALLAALVVVAVVVVLVVRSCSGGDPAPPKPGADPIGFVPAGADAVADLDMRDPLVGVGVEQIALQAAPTLRRPGRSLNWRGRAVLAQRGRLRWIAISDPAAAASGAQVTDPRVGVEDGVLVIAPDARSLRAVLAAGSEAGAPARARRAFDARVRGLPRGTVARVAFRPAALLRWQAAKLLNTTWGKALRDGAAGLSVDGSTLKVSIRMSSSALPPTALPFAAGAAAPQARGEAPIVVAVRGPQQAVQLARQAGLVRGLDLVDRLPGFLKPDLSDLGDSATLTTSDRKTVVLRAQPKDPGDWSSKLDRLDALSGLFRTLGLADVRIDKAGDGAYTIEQGGKLALRAGVYGGVLVLSNSPTADLRAAANAPALPQVPGAAGGLTLRVTNAAARGLLTTTLPGDLDPYLSRTSDLTGWARVEPTLTTAELQLTIQ